MYKSWKIASRIVKRDEIWDLEVLMEHVWSTFDLAAVGGTSGTCMEYF